MPQRFALLVGVDHYVADGSRIYTNNSRVTLRSLKGCVNDVDTVRNLLQTIFQFNQLRILTSSAALKDVRVPSDLEDKRPTFDNIKKGFDEILEQAHAGDFFFFFFAGHGALLQAIPNKSPPGRTNDPALMTVDYCCGKAAVRGWQLNQWLRAFHDKGVWVVVLLDSCHSGGAWRGDRVFRSPENWTPPPNLPADEAAVQGAQSKPGSRKGDLEKSWDIDPDGFTLMAACEEHQQAEEICPDGLASGAFTRTLEQYFQESNHPSMATYQHIREYIAGRMTELQQPQTFGRDRLLFLGEHEPFLTTPIRVEKEEDYIFLPIGKAHGVVRSAQFTTYSPAPTVIIVVREVQDFHSTAQVPENWVESFGNHTNVIPFRWSLTYVLRIFVNPSFQTGFQRELLGALRTRFVGDIEIADSTTLPIDTRNVWFWLRQGGSGSIELFAPEALAGRRGPILGWEPLVHHQNSGAVDAAIAIAHLTRFEQLRHLGHDASNESPPFKITLEDVPWSQKGPFLHLTAFRNGTKFKLTFQNQVCDELYFTVFILSCGFHSRQLFPTTDGPETVKANTPRVITFHLSIPDELRRSGQREEQARYRDIVRIITTRGRRLCLHALELPNIWDSDEMDRDRSTGIGRSATGLDAFPESNWWIDDFEVFLEP